MLRAQVAVAVADEAGRRAVRELGAEGGERGAAEAGQIRESPGGSTGGGERGQGLLDDGREPFRALAGLDRRDGMEARDGSADGDEVGLDRSAVGARLGGQGRGLVVAVHRDRVLDGARIVRRRHRQPVRTARHQCDHPAVDACREAAVEPQLGVAACPPAREGAVVDEREANGLLDLVRGLAGEEDPRDVGLAQLDRLGAVRVGGGVQESIRQAGRVLELGRRGTACGRCGGSHDFRS